MPCGIWNGGRQATKPRGSGLKSSVSTILAPENHRQDPYSGRNPCSRRRSRQGSVLLVSYGLLMNMQEIQRRTQRKSRLCWYCCVRIQIESGIGAGLVECRPLPGSRGTVAASSTIFGTLSRLRKSRLCWCGGVRIQIESGIGAGCAEFRPLPGSRGTEAASSTIFGTPSRLRKSRLCWCGGIRIQIESGIGAGLVECRPLPGSRGTVAASSTIFGTLIQQSA
jgi:hypothetical protein